MGNSDAHEAEDSILKREVGLTGAVMTGLGSIIGTGVFVGIGIAAGVTGPSVILAIPLAACIAICNGLSSAQLSANHAFSGGTYEYGYKYLGPEFGVTAGWVFLIAKSSSAAAAALGFSAYFLNTFYGRPDISLLVGLAVLVALMLTLIVLAGIRLSNRVNIAGVCITLTALTAFALAGLLSVSKQGPANLTPFFIGDDGRDAVTNLLYATALMFVAYTGYGRIATLGEEVRDPRSTIPRAIGLTLLVSALVYIAVGIVSVMAVGARVLAEATLGDAAPLDTVSREFKFPQVHWIVAIGAMTAMLGVLLNLILGNSRVLLAMGRRGDLPGLFARLNKARTTPYVAVLTGGLSIAALALTGDIKLAWSFSAFNVLIYYAITNLAALRLGKEERLYSPVFAWGGLFSCLFLAFWVEWRIWLAGICIIISGLIWHHVYHRWFRQTGGR